MPIEGLYKLGSGLWDAKGMVWGTVAYSGHRAGFVEGCCRSGVSARDSVHSNTELRSFSCTAEKVTALCRGRWVVMA